jgi:alpha-2-macroglobulin
MSMIRRIAPILFVASVGCGQHNAASPPSIHVLSVTPSDSNDNGTRFEVKFDQPVVSDAEVGKPVAKGDVSLSPNIEFTATWQTRQSLVVEPKVPLSDDRTLTLRLAGALEQRIGAYKYEFSKQGLVIDNLNFDTRMMSLTPDMAIQFSHKVAVADAATRCSLAKIGAFDDSADRYPYLQPEDLQKKLSQSKATVKLKAAAPVAAGSNASDHKQNQHEVMLQPESKLELATEYMLTCHDLRAENGATMNAPVGWSVFTHGAFDIVETTPKDITIRAVGERIRIRFATPVSLEAVQKAISSTPAIPNLGKGWMSDDNTVYSVAGKFKAFTDYKITIAGLTDSFDQKQKAAESFAFKVTDAHPALNVATGITVVEAANGEFPIWSRNVGSYTVNCAPVPLEKTAAVLAAPISFNPRWDDKDPGIDWNALGLKPKTISQTVTKDAAEFVEQKAKLADMCGGNAGMYLVEVSSSEIKRETKEWGEPFDRARAIVNVTNLGVVLKAGGDTGLAWVTDFRTGAPVANAKVNLLDQSGKTKTTGTTDKDGLFRFAVAPFRSKVIEPVVSDEESERDFDGPTEPTTHMIAVVQSGSDVAVTSNDWSDGLQSWNFGVNTDSSAASLRGFIQSDRGLYRTGDQVHFKGIIRDVSNGRGARPPKAGTAVAVSVKDSRDEEVFKTTAKLSAFGGFAFDYQIADAAHTGDYYVSATLGKQTFRERFSVEEFRTATFLAAMSTNVGKSNIAIGDAVSATVKANYLFGAPVDHGKVKWTISRRPRSMSFPGFEQFTFDTTSYFWWDYQYSDYSNQIKDGEATTDGNGMFTISETDPDAKNQDIKGAQDYIISATVSDQSNQAMSASTVVTAHRQDAYVGIHTEDYVQAAGKPFNVEAVALGIDNKQIPLTGTIKWTKQNWDCEWNYYNSRDSYECNKKVGAGGVQKIAIAGTGTTTAKLSIAEPGSYDLMFEGKDRAGRAITTASSIWITGRGVDLWQGSDGTSMKVIVGKASYRNGEVARIVPQSNLKQASTLVSIERDGILDARVIPASAAGLDAVELPIVSAWGPNVFASITQVSGRQGKGDRGRPQLKMGVATINVDSKDRELGVKIELDNGTHRPGDTVTGKIKVTSNGSPVAAELSLAVADEGVLKLIDYKTPNPMRTFYAPWSYGVHNASNLPNVLRPLDPNGNDIDEGGDFASSNDNQKVRSKFMATAYWAPTLVTDSNGEATFSFVAPDNLTTFRLMAVAADANEKFGAGELPLLVTKPLVLTPALTRVLRPGDSATMGLLINNRTAVAGTAMVTMKVTGAVASVASAQVQVPANGTARVEFPVVASNGDRAQFDFTATLGANKDAVTLPVPIMHTQMFDQRTIASLDLTPTTPFAQTLRSDPNTLLADSEAIITIDRSGLGELEPSLRYLVEYPYGCLEQTISRMMPLVAARDLSESLGGTSVSGEKAQNYIKIAVAKLQRHQHSDGHFSLWPDSETYPHLTAYAIWALDKASRAGIDVPKKSITDGIAAMTEWINAQSTLPANGDSAALAMGTYVAAMRGVAMRPAMTRLYEIRAGLPRWGQAFLWRAMVKAKMPANQLAEMKLLVIDGIAVTGDSAFVTEPATRDYDHMHSNARATAMVLDTLLDVAPKEAVIAKLAKGLLAARDKAGVWESTQDNVWSLLALSDFAKSKGTGSSNAKITIGGKIIASPVLQGPKVATLRIPLSQLQNAELKIEADSNAHITVRTKEAKKATLQAEDNGLGISREYLNDKDVAITKFAAGDLVTVKITISSKADSKWVAVADRMPGGFEPVNTKLGPTAPPKADDGDSYDQDGGDWRNWWVSYAELRDDQALWFIDTLSSGSQTLTYQVRATTAGSFTAPAATIERMYEPHINGRSTELSVTIGSGVNAQTAITKPAKTL